MRAVRFTAAEAALLRTRVQAVAVQAVDDGDAATCRLCQSIVAKMDAAAEPTTPGPSAGEIERELVRTACGKVIALVKPNWAVMSRRAASANATAEGAAEIGRWLARQGWLRGALTLDLVLNKWSSYLARARAEAPGGIDGPDLGQGAQGGRPASTAGRRPPGL